MYIDYPPESYAKTMDDAYDSDPLCTCGHDMNNHFAYDVDNTQCKVCKCQRFEEAG